MIKKVYLGKNVNTLQVKGGLITAREIEGQPELWRKVFNEIEAKKVIIREFLDAHIRPGTKIILTGAGSSAFIGTSLQGAYRRNFNRPAAAIATTDLLTHPLDYINPADHHLIVSFARSGDSPESTGALEVLNKVCPEISHLIITCNKEGKLVREIQGKSVLPVTLPPDSNDQGLAMTGSFTSMLLAGLLISNIDRIQSLGNTINRLCHYAGSLLKEHLHTFEELAALDFDRALFLGSGPLLGCAIESHLKLQELTNGKIICKFDSFLGLRHGPKVVINSRSLVIALLSNNPHSNRFEMDLLSDICRLPSAKTVIISESHRSEGYIRDQIYLSEVPDALVSEDFLPVLMVIPAQLVGFFKSLNLNLNPDSPAENNVITRVVTGVTVYPFNI